MGELVVTGGTLRFVVPQLLFWGSVAVLLRLLLGADITTIPFGWLMASWVAGNIADCVTTVLFLRLTKLTACEQNLTTRWFAERLGVLWGPVTHKLLFFVPYTLLLCLSEWALAVFTLSVWWVSVRNLRLYLRYRYLLKSVWFARGLM